MTPMKSRPKWKQNKTCNVQMVQKGSKKSSCPLVLTYERPILRTGRTNLNLCCEEFSSEILYSRLCRAVMLMAYPLSLASFSCINIIYFLFFHVKYNWQNHMQLKCTLYFEILRSCEMLITIKLKNNSITSYTIAILNFLHLEIFYDRMN